MVPINYSVNYDNHAIAALLLMMLTNAIGDVFSLKITLGNVNIIFRLYKSELPKNHKLTLKENMMFEFKIYIVTIRDMLFALMILFFVLVLTSVYFGVSVGEYKFELSRSALEGIAQRIIDFGPRF